MSQLNKENARVVVFGEILWDLLPTGAKPGGAPMNVAYHLENLGCPTILISRVGNDERGGELIEFLRSNGLQTQHIQVDEKHPTGIVPAAPNEDGEMQYEIVKQVAWDYISTRPQHASLVKNAEYLVYGSLAARGRKSRNTLFELLEQPVKKLLDINLRPPHFNKSLVRHLLEKADMLKMNLAELELITGWFAGLITVEDRMKMLQDRFKLDTLVVTLGADGAVMSDKGLFYHQPGFKVTVADTVGSGDSFLASLLSQIIEGKPVPEALSFASAVGALVASREGACPRYTVEQVRSLMEQQTTVHS